MAYKVTATRTTLNLKVLLLCASLIVLCKTQKSRRLKRGNAYATDKIISAAGYPLEKHRVYTEDGYILQLHRIPAGRRTARRTTPRAKGKRAVLIVHGLLGCSADFVIMGPERSLAFLLADAGYDVWLANLRGNYYTSHTNLTRNDKEFWDFSFHEHGKYDLSATIDRVLGATGLSKLMFIGYSMGTSSFFALMSSRPEYNSKVISFVALAPAVYIDNMKSIATLLLKTLDIASMMRARGILAINLRADVMQTLVSSVCNMRRPQEDWCMSFIYSIVGDDPEQNEWEVFSILSTRMQPASWRQFEHYGKIALTGVFTSWDDGLYGAVVPYNLSNVKVPVSILYGHNDHLTEKSQILQLANELSDMGVLEDSRPACSWPKFNHLDFVFAKDVGELLNRPLVTYIDKLFNKYGNA